MFNQFKSAMQSNFERLLAMSQNTLYVTDVDKDLLWRTYLDSFPSEEQQEHNCNSCKSFIRHYGGVVAIIGNEIRTIWNFDCKAPYDLVVAALDAQVRRAKIVDIFLTDNANMGTDKNLEHRKGADDLDTVQRWEHIYFRLPRTMVSSNNESLDTLRGKARSNRNVFARGLNELTLDAVDTVLELIGQNSLYRGSEYKAILEHFRLLKKTYDAIPLTDKENWTWATASRHAGSVAQIRNTAIGTLLVNISEGMDLDVAVGKFEAIMAPTNYKRPNAIITDRMIKEAEKTIEELGYAHSLGRRFATVDDITVNNMLFVDRDTRKAKGLLDELQSNVAINPKTLSKVEEMSIDHFIVSVLPQISGVEVLFEDRHVGNLMSLIAAKDAKGPSMFKWPNTFSWSYKNAVADSMKEKVKAAGGRVDGELRVSLEWYNFDDLDLHVIEPGGREIHFRDKVSPTSGHLDVDMNAGSGTTRSAVENIIWTDKKSMKEGKYQVVVNQYHRRENIDVGFAVEIECQGQVFNFAYSAELSTGKDIRIAEFTYGRKEGVIVSGGESKVNSRSIWGIETNKFHKASMLLKSPNWWDDHYVGNSHLFFILDQAHNDEQARGFFNEFLKPELEKHKRVFEALGSRSKVDPADKQVSGLGFSSTQHTDLIVRVSGSFNRTLKINF